MNENPPNNANSMPPRWWAKLWVGPLVILIVAAVIVAIRGCSN